MVDKSLYQATINEISKVDVDMTLLRNNVSHKELQHFTNTTLKCLLSSDSFLADLPSDIIVEEVQRLIAVEHGQAITVSINRDPEQTIKVIVPQNITVSLFKKAIKRHFEIYQHRLKDKTKISWKYIWRTYLLSYDGLILDDDNALISNYNICNKSQLKFVRKKRH